LAVQLIGGSGSGSLKLSVTGPTGITFSVSPAQLTVSGGTAQTSVMVGAKPLTSLAAGKYLVNVTASGGGASYTQSLNIQVVKYLVIVEGSDFAPPSYTVPVGATVTWLRVNGIITENDDGTNNIHFTTANIPASPGLAQLDSYSYTFTTAGTYPYKSDYRPTDSGTIIVTP
jgi:plastocyanin